MEGQWIIKDWVGNFPFGNTQFQSFEDGEEFLCGHFDKNSMDYEEWRGEYEVKIGSYRERQRFLDWPVDSSYTEIPDNSI